MQNVLCGMLKGMGLQYIASIGTIFTSLAVSIPFGLLFAFKMGMSIAGLWYGLCVGLTVLGIMHAYSLITADWNQIALEAYIRACKDEVESEGEDEIKTFISSSKYDPGNHSLLL